MIIENNLEKLGIILPSPAAPIGNYVTAQRAGEFLFLSGAGPMLDGKPSITGRLGETLSIQQGYDAAQKSALNLIATLKKELGDLDRIVQIVKLLGFVNCTADFGQQPAVINGASDLIVAVFGDKGRHARSAVGVNALPNNIPVEVEMIALIK